MKTKLRIAITGPESSGKTTLATELAKALNGSFVPEYARAYLLALNDPYTRKDLDRIAEGQVNAWHEVDRYPLISDTEMLVMTIWSEVSYTTASDYILEQLAQQEFDHYFLCLPDIPWEEDPLREHPEMRDELYARYHERITTLGWPFTVISGSYEERLATALSVIESL